MYKYNNTMDKNNIQTDKINTLVELQCFYNSGYLWIFLGIYFWSKLMSKWTKMNYITKFLFI